jgi:Bacterial protein of unknown function (DUF937)
LNFIPKLFIIVPKSSNKYHRTEILVSVFYFFTLTKKTMLEQLMGMIQSQAQEAIVNNPAVPNQHNDGAMQTILSSVLGGMQQSGQGGGDLMGMLGGLMGGAGGASSNVLQNPMVAGIAQNAIGGLMEKFGIENEAAKGIVSQVLPGLLGQMVNQHNDTNNAFNMGDVMGAMSDGKLDMGDILNIGGKLLGGGGGNAAGGLGGLLGGLFGGK